MPETPAPNPPSVPEIQARLRNVARSLREAGSADAEAQHALADLVDELDRALAGGTMPPAEVARLAESTAHLAEALHHQRDAGVLSKARNRLERAMLNAEAHAPLAVGLARRLMEALANIGI
jgi:hypothetical protein